MKRNYNTTMAVIPVGFTKYLQAPDACSNKPSNNSLREQYNYVCSSNIRVDIEAHNIY